jgi:hypothetical protein
MRIERATLLQLAAVVLYTVCTDVGVPMNLVMLIQMCVRFGQVNINLIYLLFRRL